MQNHMKIPAKRTCCSTVEQLCLNRRLFIEKERPLVGWKISQVEKFVGLPRRDVQRACYSGKGGAGILTPKDGGWGRRTYTEEDLATLFLVSEMKREGLSLPEAKRKFEHSATGEPQTNSLLESQEWRLEEELEGIAARMLRARALRLALTESNTHEIPLLVWRTIERSLATHLDNLPQSRTQLARMFFNACESIVKQANNKERNGEDSKDDEPDSERSSPGSKDGKGATEQTRSLFAAMESPEWPTPQIQRDFAYALETPGLDLAVELWLGPKSFDVIRAAFE